jgi:hypothetical protein
MDGFQGFSDLPCFWSRGSEHCVLSFRVKSKFEIELLMIMLSRGQAMLSPYD